LLPSCVLLLFPALRNHHSASGYEPKAHAWEAQ
jgi:hypothetical protein